MRIGERATAWSLLGVGMAGAAVLTFTATAGHNLFADELQILSSYRSWDPGVLLEPAGGHLIITSLAVYKGIFELFGADSYLPNRIMHVTLALICAGLFYALARRRIGDLPAVAPTLLLVFLGSSAEIVATPFGSLGYMGLAFGLATLLALEREDRAGDVAACVFFALGLASYSIVIAFGAAAAVMLWFRDPKRPWRHAWILLAPALIYAIWRVAFSQPGETNISLSNVADMPSAMFTMLAAACAGIAGLFRGPGPQGPVPTLEWGYPLAVVLIGLVVLRLSRGPAVDRRFWAALAGLISFWALVAINLGPLREPDAGRYVHISTVFLLLVAIELAAGLRVPRWAGPALAGATALSLLANGVALQQAGDQYRYAGQIVGAQLAATEIARDSADPETPVLVLPDLPVVQDLMIPVSDYLAAADDLGSPGYTPEELALAPEIARASADGQIARLLGLHTEPLASPPAGCEPLPAIPVPEGGVAIRLPPGGAEIAADPGAPVTIGLRRFAEQISAPLTPIAGGATALVAIPADRYPAPWTMLVGASQRVRVCAA